MAPPYPKGSKISPEECLTMCLSMFIIFHMFITLALFGSFNYKKCNNMEISIYITIVEILDLFIIFMIMMFSNVICYMNEGEKMSRINYITNIINGYRYIIYYSSVLLLMLIITMTWYITNIKEQLSSISCNASTNTAIKSSTICSFVVNIYHLCLLLLIHIYSRCRMKKYTIEYKTLQKKKVHSQHLSQTQLQSPLINNSTQQELSNIEEV